MTKEWIEKRRCLLTDKLNKELIEFKNNILNYEKLDNDTKEDLLFTLEKIEKSPIKRRSLLDHIKFELPFRILKWLNENGKEIDSIENKLIIEYVNEFKINNINELIIGLERLDYYLDKDPVYFNGDVIITDPCYILKNDIDDDWYLCNFGSNFEKLGINTFSTSDTLYGDWSCTTYDLNTKNAIGEFCADSGLVSVLSLDEVLKYNQNYTDYIDSYTATYIKNFKGKIQIIVKMKSGDYKETTEYHNKDDYYEYFYVQVIGHGINSVTGERIDFVGKQTGI